MIFEFERDGAPNPKATKVVKPWVIEDIKATGDFSEIVETPVASGAVLSIKFNNLVVQEELDKAKKQGFGAGLSFGLLGGVVTTDHYAVTVEYIAATGATPISMAVCAMKPMVSRLKMLCCTSMKMKSWPLDLAMRATSGERDSLTPMPSAAPPALTKAAQLLPSAATSP